MYEHALHVHVHVDYNLPAWRQGSPSEPLEGSRHRQLSWWRPGCPGLGTQPQWCEAKQRRKREKKSYQQSVSYMYTYIVLIEQLNLAVQDTFSLPLSFTYPTLDTYSPFLPVVCGRQKWKVLTPRSSLAAWTEQRLRHVPQWAGWPFAPRSRAACYRPHGAVELRCPPGGATWGPCLCGSWWPDSQQGLSDGQTSSVAESHLKR